MYSVECCILPALNQLIDDSFILDSDARRYFFLQLKVEFVSHYSHPPYLCALTEFMLPTDERLGLNYETWDTFYRVLGQLGVPNYAFRQVTSKFMRCTTCMVGDRRYEGRRVLPIYANILCMEDGYEAAPLVERVEVEAAEVVCTICLEDMLVASVAGRLPCSHLFHEICIENWLVINRICPVCRLQM